MTIDDFIKKYDGKGIDLLAGSESRKVDTAMAGTVGKHKVVQSVVVVVAVNVVNHVIRVELSTKKLLVNKSVPLSFPVGMSLPNHVFFLARGGAIDGLASLMASVVRKALEAVITYEQSLSGSVITISGAKSGTLRRWGFKLIVALFAGIRHLSEFNIQSMEVSR